MSLSCMGWRASATLETSFMSASLLPPPLLSSSVVVCRLLNTQLLRREKCVCVSALPHKTETTVCVLMRMADSLNLSSLLPSLTPPHGNTPQNRSALFSSILTGPGEEHQHPPHTPCTLEGNLPTCQMRRNFFWLHNELHIPNRRPRTAQLGPINDWMKDWVASSCRLMDGISSCAQFFPSVHAAFTPYLLPFLKTLSVNIYLSARGRALAQTLALLLDAFQLTQTNLNFNISKPCMFSFHLCFNRKFEGQNLWSFGTSQKILQSLNISASLKERRHSSLRSSADACLD